MTQSLVMGNNLSVVEMRGQAVVGSRVIAEKFNKTHDYVLKTIRHKVEGIVKNDETPQKYFLLNNYISTQNGQEYPEYQCTRDGFSLLAMGFTGNEALGWQIKYISAFNIMEGIIFERRSSDWLLTRENGKLSRRNETDVIKRLIPYAEEQGSKNAKWLYTTYSNLVNSLVGIKSKQRDKTPHKTLFVIRMLEDMTSNTISEQMVLGTPYKEIYQICKLRGQELVKHAYLPTLITN